MGYGLWAKLGPNGPTEWALGDWVKCSERYKAIA